MHVHADLTAAGTGTRVSIATVRRRVARRTLDIVAAGSALLVFAPVMLALAVIIRLTSPGPALFRQTRVGLHGKPFVMFKFRTMQDACSDQAHREYVTRLLADQATSVGELYKLDSDPRITKVGSLLRRLSLDELPQLINVLRGDMSLVGPRPALPWECEMFPPFAKARFSVPPGLTGLWQVSGRNRLTFLQALELDVRYATEHTTWQDLKILARTVPAVFRGAAR